MIKCPAWGVQEAGEGCFLQMVSGTPPQQSLTQHLVQALGITGGFEEGAFGTRWVNSTYCLVLLSGTGKLEESVMAQHMLGVQPQDPSIPG